MCREFLSMGSAVVNTASKLLLTWGHRNPGYKHHYFRLIGFVGNSTAWTTRKVGRSPTSFSSQKFLCCFFVNFFPYQLHWTHSLLLLSFISSHGPAACQRCRILQPSEKCSSCEGSQFLSPSRALAPVCSSSWTSLLPLPPADSSYGKYLLVGSFSLPLN